MKKYKYLIPICLLMLMVLSSFNLVNKTIDGNKKYEALLKDARKKGELDIIDDAVQEYEEALEIKENFSVRMEIGSLYAANKMEEEAVAWGEDLVQRYPYEAESYLFLLQRYIEKEDFQSCFKLDETARRRNINSTKYNQAIGKIEYYYTVDKKSYENVSEFSDQFSAVCQDGKWGYVNQKGESSISCRYDYAGPFLQGLAPVKSKDKGWHYIAKNGKIKVAVQNLKKCTDLGGISGDLLVAADEGRYAFYNREFELQSDVYDKAYPVINGVGFAKKGDKWCFLNENLQEMTSYEYDEIIVDSKQMAFLNDRLFVWKSGKLMMIGVDGTEIFNDKLEDARPFGQINGYAAVKTNGKWGFINKEGKVVIPPEYEDAASFTKGLAAVKKDGKWGFIDKNNKMVLENKYEDAGSFNDKGCVFVKDGKAWVLLKLYKYNY